MIPKNVTNSPSGLERAIDELGVWLAWRNESVLGPLFEIFGYPDGYKDEVPSNENEMVATKKQKTG